MSNDRRQAAVITLERKTTYVSLVLRRTSKDCLHHLYIYIITKLFFVVNLWKLLAWMIMLPNHNTDFI